MSADPNDRASIEREIRQRQQHLASTVDELTERVAPKAVAQRTAASAQAKAKAAVLDEDGAVRVGRVGAGRRRTSERWWPRQPRLAPRCRWWRGDTPSIRACCFGGDVTRRR